MINGLIYQEDIEILKVYALKQFSKNIKKKAE